MPYGPITVVPIMSIWYYELARISVINVSTSSISVEKLVISSLDFDLDWFPISGSTFRDSFSSVSGV